MRGARTALAACAAFALGQVKGFELPRPSELLVRVELTGEGQAWTETRRFRLSDDGTELQDITDGAGGLLRQRCPAIQA